MGAYVASTVVEPSLLSMLINAGSTHHPHKQYPRSLKLAIGGQSKKHRIMREILNSQVEQSVLVFFARSGTPFRTVEDNGFVKWKNRSSNLVKGFPTSPLLNFFLKHLDSHSPEHVLLRASLELLSTFSETVPTSKTDVPNPPKFIGSRWISCGPIVQWFRANRQSLSTMMALSVSELHFMDLLHDLINPLFNTVGILERNTMSIANSPPLLTNLVYLLCSLAQSVHSVSFQWANLINDLATEVCRLTLLDDDGSAAILGYSLTSSMVANLEILLETTFPKMMKTDIDRNLSAYEVWLDGGVVPNQHRLMRSSLDFWKKEVETEDSEFYHLAFLADTLLRTPPTQAAAERTIKVVKRHASLKRPRLASKTNDAILRVASLSESTLSLPQL
ncbi:hypothetical protein BLNAU_24192 [Blattamonas nauphoetae]|uniref:Uncharacterized protein n=1 Tax=Blattamonas nauphoetae TaxID=2049346 RepID=A0ABQ9WN55_9EUKA|nr:hypothetical protein BLNAU_24192 [Blattamonas nauphoetae]